MAHRIKDGMSNIVRVVTFVLLGIILVCGAFMSVVLTTTVIERSF